MKAYELTVIQKCYKRFSDYTFGDRDTYNLCQIIIIDHQSIVTDAASF